jgi:hypothetical protein
VDKRSLHPGIGTVIFFAQITDTYRLVSEHDHLAGRFAVFVNRRHLATAAPKTDNDHPDCVRASFQYTLDHRSFGFLGRVFGFLSFHFPKTSLCM